MLLKELNNGKVWEYKKSKGIIRQAKKGDGLTIGPLLRDADILELKAYYTEPASNVLENTIKIYNSTTYTVDVKGLPTLMFGVVPYSDVVGIIWLVGTNDIVKVKIPFLRNCKIWLDAFSELYPVLFNLVSKENDLHINWLKWMGFKFLKEHKEYGLNRQPFIEFIKVKV